MTGVQTCALPICETAATLGIDQLIAIGEMGPIIAQAAQNAGLAKSVAVGSTSEAAELLAEVATPGDLVLVKGSRSVRTEQVIEAFGNRQLAVGNSL